MNKNLADIGAREKSTKLVDENIWRYKTEFLFNEKGSTQKCIISKSSGTEEKVQQTLIMRAEKSELNLSNIVVVNRYI